MTQAYEPAGTGFDAFDPAWQTFSDYFAKTLSIPPSVAAFEAKYAHVDDPSLAQFVADCDAANACAAALGVGGRPGQQPADAVLTGLIGFAAHTRDAAGVYGATLQNLEAMLAPSGGNPVQRADYLKKRLIDDIVTRLVGLKADALMLDRQLEPLQARLTAANEAINQTTLLNTVNQRIGYLAARLADRDTQDAPEQRQEYARWRQFVADVDNIFAAGTAAVLALGAVRSQVRKLGKLMGDTRSLLMSVCSAATTEQLTDPEWVAKALGMPAALASWSNLLDEASRFSHEESAT
jgi:hypothetical protein